MTELKDQRPNIVHEGLAIAFLDNIDGAIGVAAFCQRYRFAKDIEPRSDKGAELLQELLLVGIVRSQVAQLFEAGLNTEYDALIGLKEHPVMRQQIAALPGFGVLQLAEKFVRGRLDFQGVGNPGGKSATRKNIRTLAMPVKSTKTAPRAAMNC